MTFDDDEDKPDRPVPARRIAEQRWRTSEPWRARQLGRRRLRVAVLVLVLLAGAVALSLTASKSLLPADAAVGITGTAGGGFELLVYGCHVAALENATLYAGDPPAAGAEFGAGAIWYVQASGPPHDGNLQMAVGATPPGYRALVPFAGLPAHPPGGYFTLVVATTARQVRFVFSASLVAGGEVATASGRYPVATYEHDESEICSS